MIYLFWAALTALARLTTLDKLSKNPKVQAALSYAKAWVHSKPTKVRMAIEAATVLALLVVLFG